MHHARQRGRVLAMIHWGLGLGLLMSFLNGQGAPPPVSAQGQFQEGLCQGQHQDVGVPLIDLGQTPYVRLDGQATDYTGGLYPDGQNLRPPEHEAAGLRAVGQIVPRDEAGQPDPEAGQIGLISIGMSNAQQEFQAFMDLAARDDGVNPRLVLVNGALGGQTAEKWVDPEARPWIELEARLVRSQVTAPQVQVAWIKQTLTRGGEFPDKALALQADLEVILQNLKARFPNLQVAFLSSRTRSYTYERGLSPEPIAYETGFAVKWLIEAQINRQPDLNFDPAQGDVRVPYLSWGPYLWSDGENPRSDGQVWLAEDMTEDCTHPSAQGQQKIAGLLMAYFKTDSLAMPWFLAGPPAQSPTPTVVPTSAVAPTQPLAPTRFAVTPTAAPSLTPPPTSTPIPGPATRPASPLAPWMILGLVVGAGIGGWLWWRGRQK